VIATRASISQDPFLDLNAGNPWRERGRWPCAWITCPGVKGPPFVVAFRKRFTLDQDATIRIHVTADERYELFVDGERIGRGPERGAPDRWFYETYDLALPPGEHVVVARVWAFGAEAADAQMSVHPGFLFAPEGAWAEVLGTGVSEWEAKRLDGYTLVSVDHIAPWRGARVAVDGAAFPWGFERGEGDDWRPAEASEEGNGVARRLDWHLPPQHVLCPATLPPMLDEERRAGTVRFVAHVSTAETAGIPVECQDHLADEQVGWRTLISGKGAVVVPPNTARRVIVDLEDYYCAYPEVVTSGGAGSTVRVHWAESLRHFPDPWNHHKGNRDEIEGKYFVGFGDTFLPDGGSNRRFEPLWWQAGRYVELFVQTGDRPLTIESFVLRETRYPLEMESRFDASDARVTRVAPILIRGMQMCAHETYLDCPYYEEMMYAADTRLEVLCTIVMTRDDRLPRKALRMYDASRLASGLTQSRYPCQLMQVIPAFALWWVAMVRDYALWRDDRGFVESLMPGVRATVEGFRRFVGSDGLLQAIEGWNTIDWVETWEAGMPPDAVDGVSGVMNWQYVYVLTLAADLEARLGERELAARLNRQAGELAERAMEAFWDEERGLLADDLAKRRFSEHTQCLALLSDLPDPARRVRLAEGLLNAPDLARTSIYFSHYYFETCRKLGRIDTLMARMALWFELLDKGLKTPVESPEPARSDCHAWSSHPLYHYFATFLGIRPGSLGFRTVEIAPQLGPLKHASGRLVHPAGGEIAVEFRVEDGALRGRVDLPVGLTGTLHSDGRTMPLSEGTNRLE
jgi:alpha-L-rhamnosidase